MHILKYHFNFNRQDAGTVTLNFNPSIIFLFRRRHFLDQYRSNTELEWDHLSTNDSGHASLENFYNECPDKDILMYNRTDWVSTHITLRII